MNEPPLPPHERSWRHPSELAPTVADVTDPGPGRGAMLLGTIAVATVALGVMALALAPGGAGTDGTASATTVTMIDEPPRVRPRFTIATLERPTAVPLALAPPQRTPRLVSSATTPDAERTTAQVLPDLGEIVIVLTEDMLYRVRWGAIAELDPPDGALVFNLDGHLVGRVDGNALVAADPDLLAD